MESELRKRQKVNVVSESSIQIEEKFGYAGFTPSWLQWLNNPWCFLVGVIGLTFGQGKLVRKCISMLCTRGKGEWKGKRGEGRGREGIRCG